jgi:AcrR family transcriptional regulator
MNIKFIMDTTEYTIIQPYILQLEAEGLVTRTFRRLDPERQEAVINAILDEATEKGPTLLNIKKVAKRAGVSVGSLYTYFPNREGLLDFAVELVARFTLEEMEKYRPIFLSLPIREALNIYILGGVEWGRMYTSFVKLFARAAYQGDPELAERLVEPVASLLREIIGDLLAQAVARGELRQDIDLEATTRLIHALTIVVGDGQMLPYLNTYFQIHDKSMPPERMMDALLEMVLEGIGTPGE